MSRALSRWLTVHPRRTLEGPGLPGLYATLLAITKAMVRATSIEALFEETCRVATELGGFDLAWIGRLAPEGDRLEAAAAQGALADYVNGLFISLDPESPFAQGITGTCFREGQTRVCNDWKLEPFTIPWREHAKSYGICASAAVPIFHHGRVAAALTLYSRRRCFFLPEHVQLMEGLGADLSLAWERLAREEERRAAESSLRESELRFRTLFETATIPMVITRGSQLLEANMACAQQFGAESPEALKAEHILRYVAPADQDKVRERNREREAGLKPPSSYEILGRRLDGSLFPIALDAARMPLVDGPATLLFLKDISEAKRHQEEIIRLNAGLELRVQERTLQLEEANKEVGSFAYSIAHDLRAPLRQITGFSELLGRQLGAEVEPKAGHYLEVIQRASRRMDQLIKDVLSFSSVGLREMRMVRLDLNPILRSVLEELQPECGDRSVRWQVGQLPQVVGDSGLLFLLLQNLLSNAVKFTRRQPEAVIEVMPMGDLEGRVGFYVKDNGAGFDPAHAERLFGLFQRLHREEDFEGTGIGLANAQRIVARHGGTIRAESTPNHGATFYVTLPAP